MSRRGPRCYGSADELPCPVGEPREFYDRDTGSLSCVHCPLGSATIIHRPVAWHARRVLIRPRVSRATADQFPEPAVSAHLETPGLHHPTPAAIAAKHAEWSHLG